MYKLYDNSKFEAYCNYTDKIFVSNRSIFSIRKFELWIKHKSNLQDRENKKRYVEHLSVKCHF